MSYILPSYVLKLPDTLSRHIGTFLTHPDTQARQYRTLTIATKMRRDLEDRIIEITCSRALIALYKQPDVRHRYESMMEVHGMLEKFLKTPFVNIDTMMRTYKFHGMGWYSRDVQPFLFLPKYRIEKRADRSPWWKAICNNNRRTHW